MDMLRESRQSQSSRIIIPIEIRKASVLKGRDIRISLEGLDRYVKYGEPIDSDESRNNITGKGSPEMNNTENVEVYKRDIGCILCSETEGLVEINGYTICSKCTENILR
jgi:hypothetical protein